MLKPHPIPWRAWPRETRDTLFVLLVIALSIAPLLVHLPLWCGGLMVVVLFWRASLAMKRQALPNKWWLAAVLALAMLGVWLSFRTLLGREAGVSLLTVLLALKTLEWHQRRDAFVVFFLAFFVMLSNFLFSQSLLVAASMLLALWGWLTALVLMHRPVGTPRIWEAAKTAAGMTGMGIPVVVVLFVLFPRFAPLWHLPSNNGASRSGLSSTMTVGSMASVALDEAVALRVQWLDPSGQPLAKDPPQSDLYFRGPVLSQFDGRQWLAAPRTDARLPAVLTQGQPLHYRATLEAHGLSTLLTLDVTAHAPQSPGLAARMDASGQWVSPQEVSSLLRYSASGHTQYQLDPQGAALHWAQEVALPRGINPRTVAWASQIRQEHPQASARELAEHLMTHLRSGGYTYTLLPGEFGLHSADEFWFDKREGFCEHMAASFVIALRAMDVPARVVTGYQGGERNPVDGVWTVRQSDAHAWVEVWQVGRGWMRFDPTGAVSPSRIGQFKPLLPQPGFVGLLVSGALEPISPDALHRLRAVWEAANNVWNQQVLSYTQTQQLRLLENLGFEAPDWQSLVQALGMVLSAAALLGVVIARSQQPRPEPWVALLRRARAHLHHQGVPIPLQATPRQMMACITQAWPDRHSAWNDWLLAMEKYRYSPSHGSGVATLARQYARLP